VITRVADLGFCIHESEALSEALFAIGVDDSGGIVCACEAEAVDPTQLLALDYDATLGAWLERENERGAVAMIAASFAIDV
jgi:hypothetical protein